MWRLQQAGYQNAVALLGEEMSDRQATVITAMASESAEVLVLVSSSVKLSGIVTRLALELYVHVEQLGVSAPYLLPPLDLRAKLA